MTVEQYDGDSFAINAVITGTAWDGQSGPYPLDIIAYDRQFGLIERVEIQPPGSSDWYYAVDTSGANGELTKENHPFKTWSFDWDLSAHPDGESDVTFRIRSYDGLDSSSIRVRKFKLNLVPPTLYLNEPLDGSVHSNGKILFTGTASDPYAGTWGSDIQDIWFDVTGSKRVFLRTLPSMVQLLGLMSGTLRNLKPANIRSKYGRVTATSVTICKELVSSQNVP